MKQEQTMLYQGDTFELDSLQYIFDHDYVYISKIFELENSKDKQRWIP